MGRILLVTPLRKELDALLAVVSHGAPVVGERVPLAEVEALGMLCAAAGHGKAQFALVTQHLIETRGPFDAVVIVGASGALAPTLVAGDVVIGTESVEYDYRPRFHGDAPPPRHPTSESLRAEILAAQPAHRAFALHEGPIAGGDEDIVEADRAQLLHDRTGALCVAWEGPGGARAAAFSGLPFVELRAVTDAADSQAAASYRVELPRAVGHIGHVLVPWLRARIRDST